MEILQNQYQNIHPKWKIGILIYESVQINYKIVPKIFNESSIKVNENNIDNHSEDQVL